MWGTIAATDPPEQNTSGGLFEKLWCVPGKGVGAVEQQADWIDEEQNWAAGSDREAPVRDHPRGSLEGPLISETLLPLRFLDEEACLSSLTAR